MYLHVICLAEDRRKGTKNGKDYDFTTLTIQDCGTGRRCKTQYEMRLGDNDLDLQGSLQDSQFVVEVHEQSVYRDRIQLRGRILRGATGVELIQEQATGFKVA